jgi:hypothetical protein
MSDMNSGERVSSPLARIEIMELKISPSYKQRNEVWTGQKSFSRYHCSSVPLSSARCVCARVQVRDLKSWVDLCD